MTFEVIGKIRSMPNGKPRPCGRDETQDVHRKLPSPSDTARRWARIYLLARK